LKKLFVYNLNWSKLFFIVVCCYFGVAKSSERERYNILEFEKILSQSPVVVQKLSRSSSGVQNFKKGIFNGVHFSINQDEYARFYYPGENFFEGYVVSCFDDSSCFVKSDSFNIRVNPKGLIGKNQFLSRRAEIEFVEIWKIIRQNYKSGCDFCFDKIEKLHRKSHITHIQLDKIIVAMMYIKLKIS